jgi:uncharacterized protein DUF4154
MAVNRGAVLVFALLLAARGGTAASAQGATAIEHQVKAAFLVNFAKFVEWPPSAAPLVICIVDDDDFARVAIDTIQKKTINGRALAVRAVGRAGDDIHECSLVFVASEAGSTGRVLGQIDRQPILTVGESEFFLQDGGMIRLFRAGDRLRFQINAGAAQQRGLKVSSQLLSLAVP